MSSTGGTSGPTARNTLVDFWIYTGLVLGALASVSANIAYTYIPPHSQPEWWPRSRVWDPASYIPPPGDVAVAVFCPVAIFILTEVITRPRWRDGKLSFTVRLTSAVMVGLPVAVASYLHLCSLLEYYSTTPFIAYTLPLTVDGLMLACTAALQLTGPVAAEATADLGLSVPYPRVPLDDMAPTVGGTRVTTGSAIPTAGIGRGLDSPSVGPVPPAGGWPQTQVGVPSPPVGHRALAEPGGLEPAGPPVRPVGNGIPPIAPPVGLAGSLVDTALLPPELLSPPVPPVEPNTWPLVAAGPGGDGGPIVSVPTGGSAPVLDGTVPGRPVASGRLGAADLTDAQIIKLALADNPNGKITGTALRKDFGVGPNRAARIRDEITRRRLAARLAGRIRARLDSASEPPGTATEPSAFS